MVSLVLAVVLSGAPPNLTRKQILEVMTQQPTTFCGTGNPWLLFVDDQHSRGTNKLLMAMTDDATLTPEQREYSLIALAHQAEPTVLSFLRARFAKTSPGSWERHTIARMLIHLTPAEMETVVRELGAGGKESYDDSLLIDLNNTPVGFKPTKATVALVHDYRAKIADSKRKASALQFLARFDPAAVVPAALRSGDSEQIDAVMNRVEGFDIAIDDAIEGLNSAAWFGRQQLDLALARRLLQLIRSGKPDPALTTLATEWVSASPRRGLTRAPLSAYVLGLHLAKKGESEEARRILLAGSAANDRLLGEPSQFSPDYDLLGNGIVFRIALTQLAWKANERETAHRYGEGITIELERNETAKRVLNEFTVGPKIDVAALEKKLSQ